MTQHLRERDTDKRKALIRAFEKRLFEQAYQQPLLWWHRIVPSHKVVMGWKMSPSHNLGAELAEVWLNSSRPRPSAVPASRGEGVDAGRGGIRRDTMQMLRYTLNRCC